MTRIIFPLVSNNVWLICFWALTISTFKFHVSANILLMAISMFSNTELTLFVMGSLLHWLIPFLQYGLEYRITSWGKRILMKLTERENCSALIEFPRIGDLKNYLLLLFTLQRKAIWHQSFFLNQLTLFSVIS